MSSTSPRRSTLTFTVPSALLLFLGPTARAGGGPASEMGAWSESVRSQAPSRTAPTDATAAGKLGTEKMRKANRAAGEILKSSMERDRPDDLQLLRGAGEADVVVVEGNYDRAQDALAGMAIKHVLIPAHLLDQVKLLATQTLMVNCPGVISAAAIENVRGFVHRGGHLITTDWALLNLTQRAFPGFIRHNGKYSGHEVMAVQVHDASDPLLSHVKMHERNPRWWLETQSYPIKVVDPKHVSVLVSSRAMKKKYGDGAVVVAFDYGEGRVVHMTSHFYLQDAALVARGERAKGSTFAKGVGLTDAQVAKLKGQGVDLDEVAVGEVNGAYAMQQLSANIVVGKQRSNDKLMRDYSAEVKEDRDLEQQGGSPSAGRARVRKGFRVKVLKEEKDRLLVRDLFGNEGWMPPAALTR